MLASDQIHNAPKIAPVPTSTYPVNAPSGIQAQRRLQTVSSLGDLNLSEQAATLTKGSAAVCCLICCPPFFLLFRTCRSEDQRKVMPLFGSE